MANRSDLITELRDFVGMWDSEGIKDINPDIAILTRMSGDKSEQIEIRIMDEKKNSVGFTVHENRLDQHLLWLYQPEVDPATVPAVKKAKNALATLAFVPDPSKVISELPADVLDYLKNVGLIADGELTRKGKREALDVFLAS